MSEENVAIVQRFADHWNETGEPPWAEMDPDVEFVIDPGSFVAGTFSGHRSYLRREEALEAVGLGCGR